ncbi:MAG: hypothetical protein ACTSQE_00215 [Candidatus Heimdallarchaeaceae archaeon]
MKEKEKKLARIILHQPGHQKAVTVVKEINGLIFSGDQEGKISIWDSHLTKELGWIKAHASAITDIQWVPQHNLLITSSQGINLNLWSWGDFSLLQTVKAHGSAIIKIELYKDSFFTAGRDHILKKWVIEDNNFRISKRVIIPRMDEFFLCDDKLLISCSDGVLQAYDADNLQLIKYLTMKQSKILSAIKKAGKYFPAFQHKDPYTSFMRICREKGIPVTACTETDLSVVFGHLSGLITIWRKKDLKIERVFFAHSHNITALDFFNNKIISSSLDSSITISDFKNEKLDFISLPFRPLHFSRTLNNHFLIGYENGTLEMYDEEFNKVSEQRNIQSISSVCICPNQVLCGTKDGEVKRYSNQTLKRLPSIKLFDNEIKGLYYNNGKIVSISEKGELKILDQELNEIQTMSLFAKRGELNPKGYGRYISLTHNKIFDFQKNEIMKGEVSELTKEKYEKGAIYEISIESGNVVITLDEEELQELQENKNYSLYPPELLEALNTLIRNQERITYQKFSDYVYLRPKEFQDRA